MLSEQWIDLWCAIAYQILTPRVVAKVGFPWMDRLGLDDNRENQPAGVQQPQSVSARKLWAQPLSAHRCRLQTLNLSTTGDSLSTLS